MSRGAVAVGITALALLALSRRVATATGTGTLVYSDEPDVSRLASDVHKALVGGADKVHVVTLTQDFYVDRSTIEAAVISIDAGEVGSYEEWFALYAYGIVPGRHGSRHMPSAMRAPSRKTLMGTRAGTSVWQ